MTLIENDIPIPPPRVRKGYAAQLRQLYPGQSTVLAVPNWKANGIAHRVLGKGCYRSEKCAGGTRIWRIS